MYVPNTIYLEEKEDSIFAFCVNDSGTRYTSEIRDVSERNRERLIRQINNTIHAINTIGSDLYENILDGIGPKENRGQHDLLPPTPDSILYPVIELKDILHEQTTNKRKEELEAPDISRLRYYKNGEGESGFRDSDSATS